jgi:hypothetical protein
VGGVGDVGRGVGAVLGGDHGRVLGGVAHAPRLDGMQSLAFR